MAPEMSSLISSCKGEPGIALQSRQGNRTSGRIEGEILRTFSSCGRKPWVHSPSDGDLREHFRVPMRSQGYCGVGRSISGLHWVWCTGRGPHLELRWEPQSSSPVLTWVSGCVCRFKQGLRSRSVWRHGILLPSGVVKGVSGLQVS